MDDVDPPSLRREEAPEAPPLLCHPAQWRPGSTEPQKALEGTMASWMDGLSYVVQVGKWHSRYSRYSTELRGLHVVTCARDNQQFLNKCIS